MRGDRARRRLREQTAAVILGDGLHARCLALRIALFGGIPCVVCDVKPWRWRCLIPFAATLGMSPTKDTRLLCEQLEDIAELSDETTRYLLVGAEDYRAFIEEHAESLESRYIITDAARLVPAMISRKI